MCGLAGFCRHPNAPRLDVAVKVAERLIGQMQSRGNHAMGVATIGGPEAFVFKWARPAAFVLDSDAWKVQREKITANTTVLIGHTRYATQNNASKDEAAHPFRMGQVCGAHNGVIRNWIELARQHEIGGGKDAWIVDSQAAFALLDKCEKPEDAIKQLDGYWALTWTKGGSLFFTRADAPLSVAYVPEMQTLFWCSEMGRLRSTLDQQGLKYDAWEAKSAVIYEYDPRKFDADGSHAERTEITLHRTNTKQDWWTTGRRPAGAVQGTLDDKYPWDTIPGGFSTRSQLAARGYGPDDDGADGKQERRGKGHKGGRKGRGAEARTEDLDTSKGVSLNGLARVVQRLASRLTEAELQIDILRQENAALYEMLGGDIAPGMPEPEVCVGCQRGEEAGPLLPNGAGYVHESCVLVNT